MEQELNQEKGEDQLELLIKQAGDEARIRRKATLDAHFSKLKKVIIDAVSHQQTYITK